jgi:hypothetical protein
MWKLGPIVGITLCSLGGGLLGGNPLLKDQIVSSGQGLHLSNSQKNILRIFLSSVPIILWEFAGLIFFDKYIPYLGLYIVISLAGALFVLYLWKKLYAEEKYDKSFFKIPSYKFIQTN